MSTSEYSDGSDVGTDVFDDENERRLWDQDDDADLDHAKLRAIDRLVQDLDTNRAVLDSFLSSMERSWNANYATKE
jgi:hypothetical protein